MGAGAIVFSKSCMSLPAASASAERRFLSKPGGLRGPSVAVWNGPGLHRSPQQHPGGTAANPQLQSGAGLRPGRVL